MTSRGDYPSMAISLLLAERMRARHDELSPRYRLLSTDPEHCLPMILITTPVPDLPRWEDRLADPGVMLEAELAELAPHLEIGDDRTPSVRVELGTAQVAAAFGCTLYAPENSLPCAGSHALGRAEDVFSMPLPGLDAGWYSRVWSQTAEWRRTLPAWLPFDLPDIQSAFNSAHLIRGNDILTDLYDCPRAVERLLDLVTDFMIAVVGRVRALSGMAPDGFTDWGGLWRGKARISNCSMHMISPAFYRRFVLPRDARFLSAIGGGRVHYCGSYTEVISDFYRLPMLTGVDFDWNVHGIRLVDEAPREVVVACTHPLPEGSPVLEALLAGRWPTKRNIIVNAAAPSVEEGKALLRRLRKAAGY